MKTRTDTGMNRIRLASLALLAGLLLTIAWPLNISAQEEKESINFQRNEINNNSENPGANRGTTEIGGNNWGGREWKVKKTNKLYPKYNIGKYEAPTCWVPWNECFTVLVHEANLLFLGPGTTMAEGPASVKSPPIGYFTSKESPIREDLQNPGFSDGMPPHLPNDGTAFIENKDKFDVAGVDPDFPQEAQVKSSGIEAELSGFQGGITNVVTKSAGNEFNGSIYYNYDHESFLDEKKMGRSAEPGNLNQFFATDNLFVCCNGDGTKVSATRFNPKTVGNNQEGNSSRWKSVEITAVPFEPGFGTTIGNSLRRILLSSIEGGAVTLAEIGSVDHEFRTIGNGEVDPILNPDGSLVSNLHPIEIELLIGRIEVALQNQKLKEDKRKELEDKLKKLKEKKNKKDESINRRGGGFYDVGRGKLPVGDDFAGDRVAEGGGFYHGGTGKLSVDGDFTGDGVGEVTDKPINRRGGGFYNGGRGKLAIAGNFNGDGIDDLGSYNTDHFYLDLSNELTASVSSTNGATVALNKNGNAVISSDQGITYINPDGSSVVFPNQGGVKKNMGNGGSGTWYWFSDANIKMLVKALDGKTDNGKLWIFYGSLTNVGFEMTVTDTQSGLVKTYSNPSGDFASVGDTNAF